MKKLSSLVALSGAMALVLSGCANGAEEETKDKETTAAAEETTAAEDNKADDSMEKKEAVDYSSIDASDYKTCLVSDAGGWDDKSFNESAYNGLQDAISQMKVQNQTAESKDESDFQPNIEAMLAEKCNLIIGVGFSLGSAMTNAAQAHPDVDFALVDAGFADKDNNPVNLDNARPLLFNTAEAAFLAGYVSAGTTETGIVATFGGLPIPSVQIFMDGFYDGVMAYNEKHGENVQLLGWDKKAQTGSFSNSFDDQAKGQQLADGFIAQGADIIMPVAGPVGLGAAAAAQAAGNVKIVGVDSDWYESAPEFKSIVLTSVLKGIDASVLDTIAAGATDKFSGEPYVGSLENGGVDIAPYHDFESAVPDDVKSEVMDLKKQIISGDLKIESDNTP